MADVVGSVKVNATADASGFDRELTRAVKASMASVVKDVMKGMRDVNTATSKVDTKGFKQLEKDADAAGKAAARAGAQVEAAGKKAQDAKDREADATVRLSAAERALAAARKSGDADKIQAAEERVAVAKRASARASRDAADAEKQAKRAAEELTAADLKAAAAAKLLANAQDDVADSSRRSAKATEDTSKILKGGFAAVGAEAKTVAAKFALLSVPLVAAAGAASSLGVAFAGIGVLAAPAFAVAKLGAEGFAQAASAASDSLGRVQDAVGSTFRDELTGTFDALGNRMEDFTGQFQNIAKSLSGLFKDATAPLLDPANTEHLNQLLDGSQKFIDALGPGVKSLSQGFIDFGAAAGRSGQVLGDAFGSVLKNLGDTISELASNGSLELLFNNGAKAIEGLGNALGPILTLFVQLGGVVGDDLGSIFTSLGTTISNITEPLTHIADLFAGALATAMPGLGKGIEGIVTALDSLTPLLDPLGQIVGILGGALGDVLTAVAPAFKEIATAVSNALAPVLPVVADLFKELAPIIGKIAGFMGDVLAPVIGIIGKLLADLLPALEPIIDAFGQLVDAILPPLSALFEKLMPVLEFLAEVLGTVVGWVAELVAGFIGLLTDIVPGIIEFFTSLPETIGSALEGLGTFFAELPGKILEWIGDLAGALGTFFSEQWTNFTTGLGAIIDTAASFFTALPGKIVAWAGDLASAIGGWFAQQWENFKTGLNVVIDTASSFFTGLPGRILGWIGDAGSWLFDTGKHIIDGLVNGLRNAGDAVKTFLLNLMKDAKDAVLAFFGIASPSKVFKGIGENLMKGLANGIRDNGDTVLDEMNKVAADVAATDFSTTAPSFTAGSVGTSGIDSAGLDAASGGFTAVGDAATAAVDGQVLPATDAMTAAVTATGDQFTILANEQALPALTAVGDGTTALAEAMGTAINDGMIPAAVALGDQIRRTQAEGIQPAFDAIQAGLSNVHGFFSQTVDGVSTAWDGLRGATARPVNFMLGTVWNQGLLPAWNKVAEFLPNIQPASSVATIPGYRTGGALTGPGTGTSDDILMWGSNGEHMVTALEVLRAGGHSVLYAIRDMIKRGIPFSWDNGKVISDIGRTSLSAYGAQVAAKGIGNVNPEGLFDRILPKFATGGEISPGVVSAFSRRGTGLTDAELEAKRKEEWEKFIAWLRGESQKSSNGTSSGKTVPPPNNQEWDDFWKHLKEIFGFATGGAIEPWMVQLQKGHDFARAQNGKPYQWAGPSGEGSSFDCSGFMGSIAAAITGQNPWQRYFSTASFAGYPNVGPMGFTKGGDNGFTIGVTDDPGGPGGGHTAGTLGALPDLGVPRAVNVESGGALGDVHYGGGTDPTTFASMYHLPIGANGFFVSGGAGPTPEEMRQFLKDQTKKDFAEFIDPIKSSMPYAPPPAFNKIPPEYTDTGNTKLIEQLNIKIDELNDQLSSAWVKASGFASTKTFDTGGILSTGSFGFNASGLPERVLSPAQTAAFEDLVALLSAGGLSGVLGMASARINERHTNRSSGAGARTVVHDNRTINSPVHNHGVRDFNSFRDRDSAHLLALLDG